MTPEQFAKKQERIKQAAALQQHRYKQAWLNEYHPELLKTPPKQI